MFEFTSVTKRYGEEFALEGVDLKIEAERTTVLIGPSGCGKSTLLRLMIGLIRPTAGTVRFQGREILKYNVLDQRRRMGYVIQDGGLFPHLTAERNIALMARYLGWDERRTSQRVTELARLTHFPQDALNRYPDELSGGQRQRVGLMRALMLGPEVLLLDEPLGALDPMIRAELQQELRDIFRALGKTVVLVTHDLNEAGFFADEIVLLRQGRIVQRGSFPELVQRPREEFVVRFINAQRSPLNAIAKGPE